MITVLVPGCTLSHESKCTYDVANLAKVAGIKLPFKTWTEFVRMDK